MKSNLTKVRNYKLFKYNLLKLQVYSSELECGFLPTSNYILEQLEAYLKQSLKIVFEYHKRQLKILFVGFPVVSKIKQMKLIHFTNHNFISQKSWISGIFRNRFSIFSYLVSLQSQNFSKNLKLLLTVKAKPHLVVVFNQKVETNVINEFYKIGVPILSFNCDFLNVSKVTYKILGNFDFVEKKFKITYFFLFYSILKKIPFKKKQQLDNINKLKVTNTSVKAFSFQKRKSKKYPKYKS